jgi:hypothetical protein
VKMRYLRVEMSRTTDRRVTYCQAEVSRNLHSGSFFFFSSNHWSRQADSNRSPADYEFSVLRWISTG